MHNEIRRYFVKIENNFYYARVDTDEFTNITPHFYSSFWFDIEETCWRLWPTRDKEEYWYINKPSGYIHFDNDRQFALLRLSLPS